MTMRKSVRVEKGDIFMSLQRLILTFCMSVPPKDSIFTFELAPVGPASFYGDGTMRKNKKSLLMQYLLILVADSQETQENFKAVPFDGVALIHRLP